jgi:NAD(P)-dependent dehydrogenase (short-subunit alcohol dehydrogenase family)
MKRVVLVTGGTSGIGAAIARRLASEGADVAAGYWGFEDRAQVWLKEMTEQFPGSRFSLHEGNVGVAEDCRRVAAEVIDTYGQLDVLVNNAGITIDRTVAKMTDSDWQTVLDVDLSGAYYLSQPALAHMVERGRGRIVSISSVIGEIGNIGQANYAAAKAGLFGLTKSLAREAAFQLKRAGRLDGAVGVTVNAVTPGFIATKMVATVPEKVLDGIRAQVPLARLGRPEEIAHAVAFLASDDAAYVTGHVLAVNGGLDM